MSKKGKFRYRLFVTLATVFVLHITVFVVLLSSPWVYHQFSKPGLRQYRMNAILGPFFDAGRIQSTTKLHFRVKNDAGWQKWNIPEDDNFYAYHDNYFRFDLLKKNQHESSVAYRLWSEICADTTKKKTDLRAYKNLTKHLISEYVIDNIDSIELSYINYGKVEDVLTSERLQDTIYHIVAKP